MDLTCSNPAQVGFTHGPEVYASLITPNAACYDPGPLGLPEARAAVAAYYAGRGIRIAPDHIWIGAGTSELYAQILWLLCDPGDTVLVPQPGYPLFSYLAELCGVRLETYNLVYDDQWRIDFDTVEQNREAARKIRALIAVSPGNPTGHCLKYDDIKRMERVCVENGWALIVDEVFSDFVLRRDPEHAGNTAGEPPMLSFLLSGLSKAAALPQIKLSWAVISGPNAMRHEALARAELISDTFLNASTVAQQALPALLKAAPAMQDRIRERCMDNAQFARHATRDTSATVLDVEGGWTLLLKLPATQDDQEWAERFLKQEGVLVQPGYFFDMQAVTPAPHIAVSLITPSDIFRAGLLNILKAV